MGVWQVAAVLVRRWYVTMSGFLAALGMAVVMYGALPAQYQSGSVMVLTTSLLGRSEEVGGTQRPALTNPLLNFDNSIILSTSIIIQELNSPRMMRALGAPPGGTTTYLVSDGNTNAELLQSGPLIFVQGSGPTPEAAEEITERVGAMAARLLAERQGELDAPRSTYLEIDEVVRPTAGRKLTRSPLRAGAAAVTLAGAVSIAAALAFDRAARSRRRSSERPLAGTPR